MPGENREQRQARIERQCAAMRALAFDRRQQAWRRPDSLVRRDDEARIARGDPRPTPPKPERILTAEQRRAEVNGLQRAERYLRNEDRAQREERYVTALYGIRTSWHRIQRASLYVLVSECDRVRTGFVARPFVVTSTPVRPPLRRRDEDQPERRAA